MSLGSIRADFAETQQGRLFVITRIPDVPVRAAVLVVPPFAEEMNKARRMVTEVANGLLDRGIASVVFDLYGTGDSEGEFADVTWERWLSNIDAIIMWSADRGIHLTHVLGIRLGCLLAASYLREGRGSIEHCVFWQPSVDGSRYFDQFLRLRLAGSLFGDGPKETLAGLRGKLRVDGMLEVAGYAVPASLAAKICGLQLTQLVDSFFPQLDWIEIVRSQETAVSETSTRVINGLRASGCNVRMSRVISEPLWTSTENVVSRQLGDLTVELLCEGS